MMHEFNPDAPADEDAAKPRVSRPRPKATKPAEARGGLTYGGNAGLAQNVGADDQAFGLQIIQPLRSFIMLGMVGHRHAQFVAGQR